MRLTMLMASKLHLSYMNKKRIIYQGNIDYISKKSIQLNINYLQPGEYVLKIIHKNKVIKQTTFKK